MQSSLRTWREIKVTACKPHTEPRELNLSLVSDRDTMSEHTDINNVTVSGGGAEEENGPNASFEASLEDSV